jgi:hypothetical protein
MVHYILRNNAQENGGGFTDLFILGSYRKWDPTTKTWGSDFTGGADSTRTTTAATATTYNLLQLTQATTTGTTQAAVPIYTVQYPLAKAYVRYPFSDTADNPKLDVGVANSLTASTSLLAGAASDLELQDRVVLPAAAAVPLAPNTASQWLTATVTSAVANVSALVAKTSNPANVGVDIYIYVCLAPYREWVLDRSV